MGTHPSLPSKDVATQRSLLDLVQDNQMLMGRDITERYGGKLPFLFKVLSIRKALSIQAHPNKQLAEQLHAKDPKNYPGMTLLSIHANCVADVTSDDNHKPEMTIAITPFDGLCGFRPLAEISHFLATVPTFRKLVGEDAATNFENTVKGRETSSAEEEIKANKEALQKAFTSLMTSASPDIEATADELVSSAKSEGDSFAGSGGPSNNGAELAELVQRVSEQFPGDIGLFVLFFLNYIKLDVGEAMFLKADDIHAYLSGDIIECMASSDNVVRAGFTPKFKDVNTLTSMLTYSYAPISEQKMEPKDYSYVTHNTKSYSSASDSELYDPPIEEFSVVRTALKAPGAKATFDPIDGPSIVLCTAGKGTIAVGPKKEPIEPGYVYFVGSTAECVLESETEKGEEFVTFKAFCELEEKSKSSL